MESVSIKRISLVDDLNSVLCVIIGDYMNKLYFNQGSVKDQDPLSNQSQNNNAVKQNGSNGGVSGSQTPSKEQNPQITYINDHIMRDLFLWSVLMNHIDMAKALLCYVKYRICAALIATKVLKKYHTVASHGDLKDSYMKNANYFEQYAIDCIRQCEKNDPELAYQIVLQKIELYGNVTCLQVSRTLSSSRFRKNNSLNFCIEGCR